MRPFRGSFQKPPRVKRAKGRARPTEPLAESCEVRRLEVCTGRAEHRHHVLPRAQGGGDDRTLDVCGACHRFIHEHPSIAYAWGWLEHRPAQLPEVGS